MKTNPQALDSVFYKALDLKNTAETKQAIECIAECFSGITVNGIKKQEPLNYALEMDKNTIIKFCETFFDLNENYCFIALEKATEKVIGVIFSEIYQPTESLHSFTGEFIKYNAIFGFLNLLDDKFNKLLMQKFKQAWLDYKFLHLVAIGIKGKSQHSNIFDELVKLTIETAHKDNFAGILTEATNPKSQFPFINRHGFINLLDDNRKPISLDYKDDLIFRKIPQEMALDCKLLYKAINLEL